MAMEQESEKKKKTSQDSQPDLGSAQGRSEAGTRGVAPGNTRSTAEEKGPKMPQRWEKGGEFGSEKRHTTPPAEDQEGQDEVVNQGQQEQSERSQIESYGQEVQYKRERQGWTQEELAEKIGATVSEVQSWEANKSLPDLAWHRKLYQVLGKDIYGTSRAVVRDTSRTSQANGTLQIRITQEQLTAQNFTTIISALTELHTQCWLIQQGRFVDVIEYAQTRNVKFAEEADLVITGLAYNSPLEINFAPLDPKNIADALVTGIDGVTQAKLRFVQAKLENQARAQEIQLAAQQAAHGNDMALLEQEKRRLEIESQRLGLMEQRLELQKKEIEYALEIAGKMVTMLRPDADQVTKAMLAQTLLPGLLQLGSGKGLNLALPAPQNESVKWFV